MIDDAKKLGVSWILTLIAHVTLSQVASLLAIVYTSLQIYNMVKHKK